MDTLSKLLAATILFICAIQPVTARQGQRPGSDISPTGTSTGTITVYIRDDRGGMLPNGLSPKINLTSSFIGFSTLPIPQTTGSGWVFSGISVGHQYYVEVKLDGYQNGHENIELPATAGATASVIVYMKPVDQALVFHAPMGQFVLSPKAQKEVEAALRDLRQGKNGSALKHAEKCLQLAPGNPYVQYVMGMTLVLSNELNEAKPYLEQAVSLDPKQPPALLALGSLRFRQGDDTGAIDVLTRAVQLDGASWQAEWILANSYLREHKFEDARDHAEQALRIGKEKAGQVQLVLAQALVGLGQNGTAADTFESFARAYPKDPNAILAERSAMELRRAPVKPATDVSIRKADAVTSSPSLPSLSKLIAPAPAFEVPPRENWAPPDIDAVKPLVTSGDVCALPEVLRAAEAKAEEFADDLQKFSATEEYQATEIRSNRGMETPTTRQYNYLVFLDTTSPRVIRVEEVRGDDAAPVRLPGRLQDFGGPSLVLVFHPVFQNDFQFNCEGLGKWGDRPAWIVHFQQRADRPTSLLSSFSTVNQQYALSLKGRAWVAKSDGQVLHLETDLVKPVVPIDFMREHFAIDYAPVQFHSHHVELWLPENVDTYIQYEGRFLHHYHHFSNFKLFWVGATQTVADPKETNTPQN
jgi:tetratricopeptide (TPR) repeat protein